MPTETPVESSQTSACKACGKQRPAWSPPGRCPICGAADVSPAPAKTESDSKVDAITEKFRLAAKRAKGDF